MKTCLNTGGKLVQEIKQRGVTLTRDLEYETLIKVRPGWIAAQAQ